MTLFAKRLDFFPLLPLDEKFELTSALTQNALPVLADRIQLQQVILNLVVNGIDAMKDTPAENRIIRIQTSRVEEFAELSVSDRGPGIPEDKLNEIFEPFFTTKQEGMGMGLSIAQYHHRVARRQDLGGKPCQRRRVSREPASRLDRTVEHAAAGAHAPSHRVAQRSLPFSMIVSIASIRRSDGNGLCRYATQPASKAALRVASLSTAVMKMTGSEWPERVN